MLWIVHSRSSAHPVILLLSSFSKQTLWQLRVSSAEISVEMSPGHVLRLRQGTGAVRSCNSRIEQAKVSRPSESEKEDRKLPKFHLISKSDI